MTSSAAGMGGAAGGAVQTGQRIIAVGAALLVAVRELRLHPFGSQAPGHSAGPG